MKAILISIKPKWVEKILNGEKTIEIRKRFPKDYVGWVYIYCSKNKDYDLFCENGRYQAYFRHNRKFHVKRLRQEPLNGKVVAKFTLNKVEEIDDWYHLDKTNFAKTCLTIGELVKYLKGKNGYAWHIENLEIFDKPKELSNFKPYTCNKCDFQLCSYCNIRPLTKAPQSWCYVEGGK